MAIEGMDNATHKPLVV